MRPRLAALFLPGGSGKPALVFSEFGRILVPGIKKSHCHFSQVICYFLH
jgi:hypothetical protein